MTCAVPLYPADPTGTPQGSVAAPRWLCGGESQQLAPCGPQSWGCVTGRTQDGKNKPASILPGAAPAPCAFPLGRGAALPPPALRFSLFHPAQSQAPGGSCLPVPICAHHMATSLPAPPPSRQPLGPHLAAGTPPPHPGGPLPVPPAPLRAPCGQTPAPSTCQGARPQEPLCKAAPWKH